MASNKKTVTVKDLQREIVALDRIAEALNTAVVALYYVTKVKGDELDGVKSDDYVKFVQEHVHPLMRRADEIVKEASEKMAKQAKEAVK